MKSKHGSVRQTKCRFIFAVLILVVSPLDAQEGTSVFGPGDPIIAIDTDEGVRSQYPAGEGPANVADQLSSTKYLNFGEGGTGFIITPFFGSSTIQSFTVTTANDFEVRDPASYDLFGTNDLITSGDNSLGDQESWTLISSGALSLPAARESTIAPINMSNATAYTSYKMIFPTVKDPAQANSMQVADVQFFTGLGGSGSAVLAAGDAALAVSDFFESESDYPPDEGPANAIDQTLDKYLNRGGENSGFIVSRFDGQAVTVTGFTITTANDFSERDPASYEIYGTNDPVTSSDNSTGDTEDWTLIESGLLSLPIDRDTAGDFVPVDNNEAYTAYRIIFPTIRFPGFILMQIGEMEIEGTLKSSGGIVVPTLVTPTRGSFVSGDEASLASSDNEDYVMRRMTTDIQSRTEFEVDAMSPILNPVSFEVCLEGSVFARTEVIQTIELWDYQIGDWELVDSRPATIIFDSTVVVPGQRDLSRFVNQQTMAMRARIHFQSTNPRQRFASNTDLFKWTIE